uniref:Uncharacterized protein n=1 Tax=Loxodonta africana TaxID=9785 RepID=G3T7Q2_LOXAF
MNSVESMHQKSDDLVGETTYEDTELPGQRSRNFQVLGPCSDDETASCTTEKSNRNYCECMIPCQVISDLNKEKTIASLLKELDILRASNKKLQEKLTKEDKEQRKLKLKLELQERATEAEIAAKTAGIIDE